MFTLGRAKDLERKVAIYCMNQLCEKNDLACVRVVFHLVLEFV